MGGGVDFGVQLSDPQLPLVVPEAVTRTPLTLLAPVDRRDTSSVQAVFAQGPRRVDESGSHDPPTDLGTVFATPGYGGYDPNRVWPSIFDEATAWQLMPQSTYEEIQARRAAAILAGATPGVGPIIENLTEESDEVAIDWGNVYEEIDRGLGNWLPGGVPFQFPTIPGFGGNGGFIPSPAQTMPVPTGVPQAIPGVTMNCPTSCDHPMKGYVFNPCANGGVGKWQKRSRRRRKQLFTSRDAAQLGALIGIAGKSSELTKTWVATHS